ncbi:translesion error-prone DNA polymerase V autoproteolytic subunit [soil metagenome]
METPNRPVVGFTAPAQDGVGPSLDLNKHCVAQPTATFFMRATEHFEDGYVERDDLLVIDRAATPQTGALVVAVREGELILERFSRDVATQDEMEKVLWGVVTFVVRACEPLRGPAGN